jgi:hypothetical protein
MKTEYNVFYKNDLSGPQLSENRAHREIYDKRKTFYELDNALKFAMTVLQDRPILMKYASTKTAGAEQIRNLDTPYVLAGYFPSKYSHYCYDGSSTSVPTYEIERCYAEQLEDKLMKMAEEAPSKICWGLELKFMPSLEHFK